MEVGSVRSVLLGSPDTFPEFALLLQKAGPETCRGGAATRGPQRW